MVAVTVKKRKRFEKWHYDFQRVIKAVMKQAGKEITKKFEESRRIEEKCRAMDPSYTFWDDDKLLMTTVFLWIMQNGTREQKQVTKTWVYNMADQKKGVQANG